MTNTDIILSSLSMDLYRVAINAHRGSNAVCRRFMLETNRWISELEHMDIKSPIREIISRTKELGTIPSNQDLAEHALVYSILLKNQVVKNSEVLV